MNGHVLLTKVFRSMPAVSNNRPRPLHPSHTDNSLALWFHDHRMRPTVRENQLRPKLPGRLIVTWLYSRLSTPAAEDCCTLSTSIPDVGFWYEPQIESTNIYDRHVRHRHKPAVELQFRYPSRGSGRRSRPGRKATGVAGNQRLGPRSGDELLRGWSSRGSDDFGAHDER